MEKVIKLDIAKEEDLVEKYDNDKLNYELLNYLLKQAQFIPAKASVKIEIDVHFKTKLDIVNLLETEINDEFLNTYKEHYKNNLIQLFLFLLGITFLVISIRIKDSLWSELFLIGGWVPLWEMIELELFNDFRGKKKKTILNKLVKAQIVIVNNYEKN